MIIIGNDTEEVVKLQKQLAAKFEMKSLGGLKYFLGIEVAQSKQRYLSFPTKVYSRSIIKSWIARL